MRSAIRTKPVRVQFALMSVMTIREPLTRIAAAMWKAAEDGSPGHVDRRRARARRAGSARSGRRRGRSARPRGRAGARCGRGSARARSPSSCPEASSPAISTHDFTCADATGSVYSIPRSGMPCTVNGAKRPSVRLDPGAHLAQRHRDAVDRPAADRRVAVERPLAAGLAREPAGREPHQRAGVADVDVRLAGRAQPGPADRSACRGRRPPRPARRTRAPRSASSRCRPPRGSP